MVHTVSTYQRYERFQEHAMPVRRRAATPVPRALPVEVLVSRWHQRLAVALDEPLETRGPGADRLPAVLAAYLDTQRATTVRPAPGRLFTSLLEEDLRHLGAVAPDRAAADLLRELDAVVALEDAAGRELAAERRALLSSVGLVRQPSTCRPRWRRALQPA
jgi:hypothetical protein